MRKSNFLPIHLSKIIGSISEQLDRELLVVWLNFANGSFAYSEMLDTDMDGISDTTFADIVTAAEYLRLNNDATKAEIKKQTTILHKINQINN